MSNLFLETNLKIPVFSIKIIIAVPKPHPRRKEMKWTTFSPRISSMTFPLCTSIITPRTAIHWTGE